MFNQEVKTLLKDVIDIYSKDSLTFELINQGIIKLEKAKEIALNSNEYDNKDDNVDNTEDNNNDNNIEVVDLEKQFKERYNVVTNVNRKEIPYICREFYKHTFDKGEEVIIGFCIDSDSEDWYNEKKECLYKIKCYVDHELKSTKVYKGGSDKYNVGILPIGEHVISLEGEDIYGRTSFRDFFEIRVIEEKIVSKYFITEEDLRLHGIKNDGSDYINTATGINNIIKNLDEKYNYLVLPKGEYKLKYGEEIILKDNLTLDLNESLISLQENQSGDKNMMVHIQQCYDSHVINGTIEGDYLTHDYANSPNNSEWVHGVNLDGRSKYSSFENITIKNITGYGSCSGMGADREGGKYGYVRLAKSPKFSTVDNKSVSEIFDLKPYKLEKEDFNYFQLGKYLGYQGKPSNSWYYKVTFYNNEQEELETFNAYFYRRVYIPDNVYYAKFETFDITSGLSCFAFNVPVNCEFRNVRYEMCRCVGLAPSAMESLRVHGCYFTKCGSSGAKCAFDSEDGWDMMHDFYMDTTVFENNFVNDWLTCAGHNFLLENNEYNGSIYVWTRAEGYVIRNNSIKSINEGANREPRFVKVYNNKCTGGLSCTKALIKDCQANTISGRAIRSKIETMAYGNMDYEKCIIDFKQANSGYLNNNKISFVDCTFNNKTEGVTETNMQFNCLDNNRIFKDCTFKDTKYVLNCNNNFNSGTFENCIFDKSVLINPTLKDDNNGVIKFKDCIIPFDGLLVKLSPHAYSLGEVNIEFENCMLIDTENIVDFYGKRNELIYSFSKPTGGSIKFINCKIEKENGYLLSQYGTFGETHKLNIIFDGCEFSNKDIKIYSQTNMEEVSGVKVTIK